ncbi:MAG: NAD(P)-dependent oxidoreductase [Sporocytophaga sp.]|uniref:NAD(P)-dependent oxidoreductase n=1 Tax=Sporocytophaga sp. TaxID=2231183 RepID=UPI001B20DE1C|nr:NAD(P)-dependent oxidoreductase [Sporocytophaga sp.]MBO9699978.1 NAD(P)-dependent oxidoreductase [Sporocytophaga sp.]
MKIALIGASGFVGTAVLNEAVSRGHSVTAIARNPGNIKVASNLVTVKKADVFDIEGLASVLKGHDVVISAYNAGWGNPNLYQDFVNGSEAIQSAAKKAGVKRLLVVGGAGSLEIAPGVQLVDTPQFPAEYKTGATAARDYLNIIKKETELDWTFLSPAILMHPGITDGRTGKYRTSLDTPVFDANNESRLSVEDLSVVILDEVEQGRFIKKRFTAAY